MFTTSGRKPATELPTPTPTSKVSEINNTSKISKIDENTIFNTNQSIAKRIIKSANLVNEYEGIIMVIKTENVKSPFPPTYPYKPELEIAIQSDPQDPQTYAGFFFDKAELNGLTVRQAGETEDDKTYQDLKLGQRVNIIETYDFATKKVISYQITIL